MKIIILKVMCVTIFFLSDSLYAEKYEEIKTYQLNWLTDSLITGSGLLLFGASKILENEMIQTPASEANLNINNVNMIDRWLSFSYNKNIDSFSDILSVGILALPTLLFIKREFKEILTISLMFSQAVLLSFGLKEIVKAGISRYRPYNYFDNPSQDFYTSDSADSFISGHTTLAFTSAAFISSVFYSYYSDSKWNYLVSGGSFAIASTIAVLRIVSGNHFLSDVLLGAASGTIIGLLIPFLHKLKEKEDFGISFSTDPDLKLCIRYSITF